MGVAGLYDHPVYEKYYLDLSLVYTTRALPVDMTVRIQAGEADTVCW